jgi:hypothetical protein
MLRISREDRSILFRPAVTTDSGGAGRKTGDHEYVEPYFEVLPKGMQFRDVVTKQTLRLWKR